MSDKDARRIAEWLHAYELGFLSEAEEDALEQLLISDPSLLRELQETENLAHVIRHNPRARDLIAQIAGDQPSEQTAHVSGDAQPLPLSTRRWWSWPAPAAVAAAALLIMILVGWRIGFHTGSDALSAGNRLLVSYFENAAGTIDAGDQSVEITNLLISDLSESHHLQVVSASWLDDLMQRRRERAAGGDAAPVAAIDLGRDAGAVWVLTGSIDRPAPDIVVSAQLRELLSGTVLATRTVTSAAGSGLFDVVDSLSALVRATLLLPEELAQESDPQIADVTTHSPDAYREFLHGRDLWQKLYYVDARRSFERAVALDSTFAMAHYYLARLGNAASMTKALAYAHTATRRDEVLIRVLAAEQQGHWDSAIDLLEDATSLHSGDRELHLLLAQYYMRDGGYRDAIAQCRTALALDSLLGEAYNLMAYSFDQLGDFEGAKAALDGYHAVSPGEANPWDSRAELFAKYGHLDSAIQCCRRALELKPDFAPSRERLGGLYCLQRRYDLAEKEFSVLVNSPQPQYQASGRMLMTLLPIAHGKLREAVKLLDEYLAADSLVVNAQGVRTRMAMKYLKKTWLLAELGDCEGAGRSLAQFQAHVLENQTYAHYFREKHLDVELAVKCGDLEKARTTAQELREDLVQSGYPLSSYSYALGWIASAEGDWSGAVAAFDEASASNDAFGVRYLRARAYLEAGLTAEAVEQYEQLLSSYTQQRAIAAGWNIKLHYFLGRAYEGSGRIAEAIAQYELFVDLWSEADPEIDEVAQAKARLEKLRPGS